MKTFFKTLLPILFLSLGVGLFWFFNSHAPPPEVQPYFNKVPPVVVQKAAPQVAKIPVYSRGLVSPSTEIMLSVEVGGRVRYISPNLTSGGFFKKGELLLAVDDSQLKNDVTRVTAHVVSAQQQYRRVQAEIEAEEEVEGLNSPREFLQKRLEEAHAQLKAAEAELSSVKLRARKAELKAPFDGRVREALVGEGQLIAPGMQIARVYSTAQAQVRLPLSDRQMALIDMPDFTGSSEKSQEVLVRINYGGAYYYWTARLIGTEASLDPRNRLLYVVAEIENPFNPDEKNPQRPPLWAGQLVEAQIQGKKFGNITVLPRSVLRDGEQVWLVDSEERLQKRKVKVLYKARDVVYIADGLTYGDRVVVSPLEIAIDGMKVQTSDVARKGEAEPVLDLGRVNSSGLEIKSANFKSIPQIKLPKTLQGVVR